MCRHCYLYVLCLIVTFGVGADAPPSSDQPPLPPESQVTYIRVADGIENGRLISTSQPGDDDLVEIWLETDWLPPETDVWIETPEGINKSLLEFHASWFGPYLGELGWFDWLWPFGEDERPLESRPRSAPIQFPVRLSSLEKVMNRMYELHALATPEAFPDPCPLQPRTDACEDTTTLERPITFYFGIWDSDPDDRVVRKKQSITFRVVRGPGDSFFFHAARAYLEAYWAKVFVCERRYSFQKAWETTGEMDRVRDVSRIVVFDASTVELDVLETYYRPGPDGAILWSIDHVVEAFPESAVIVNGGYFFTNTDENYDTPGRGNKDTPHPNQIRGRLIHNHFKSPVSTQRKVDDHNPTKCELPEYYLAQAGSYAPLAFHPGKVPLEQPDDALEPDCSPDYVVDGVAEATIRPDPNPSLRSPLKEALGGLHQMHGQESASRMRASMVGSADIVDASGKQQTMFFVVSNESGSGMGNEDLVEELKRSGAVRDDGADNVYQLDTGGSVALAHTDPRGKLTTQFKGTRHETPNEHNISNYLVFTITESLGVPSPEV